VNYGGNHCDLDRSGWNGHFAGERMEKDPSPLLPVHRRVTSRNLKGACFALEALNGLATTYFFYYLYFYTEARFHFNAMQNLLLAALLGGVYALGAFFSGRFAQRFGYFTAIRCGAALMLGSILGCSQTGSIWLTVALALVGCIGMCLTWPAMEALISEGEPPARLQGLVGFYNFVWAAAAGFAYFTGGAMQQKWGWPSIFYVPAGLLAVELGLATWLVGKVRRQPAPTESADLPLLHPITESYRSPVAPAILLKMAWVANPMAYLAINTIISSVPALAQRLSFSPMRAGFICSIWLFSRAVAFVALWLWPGWHYRFRFLALAYVLMMVSFGAMLLVPDLWVLVLSQILLGPALGLIYYSSLFYSMDVGETKGEHGGIHEAVIGVGNCVGPAVAASALQFFPRHPGSGVWAVCLLLVPGLIALYWLRYRVPKPSA
jgi:DHA1 family multidrug resistance protein-like MFS transporter